MAIMMWPTVSQRKQAFQLGLLRLASSKRIASGLTIHPNPLPVYHLPIKAVVNGDKGNPAEKLVSWRYYATGGSAAAAVAGDIDPQTTRLLGIAHGAQIPQELSAAQALNEYPEFADRKYEPRILRIPGLLVEAFWLVPMSGLGDGTQWIIPYHTPYSYLSSTVPYEINAFFATLASRAESTLSEKDSPY